MTLASDALVREWALDARGVVMRASEDGAEALAAASTEGDRARALAYVRAAGSCYPHLEVALDLGTPIPARLAALDEVAAKLRGVVTVA